MEFWQKQKKIRLGVKLSTENKKIRKKLFNYLSRDLSLKISLSWLTDLSVLLY